LLREAVAEAGLSIRYSTALVRDLERAALFIYITHSEGLGSAALLAMAAGVPVVASNVGGLPEIVENEVTGILTENNKSAIVQAIRQALARREILAENARKTVEQRFTTSVMLKNTIRVYERVLGC
jgi:glycosyltransferase involved in cell wall biosynthesis